VAEGVEVNHSIKILKIDNNCLGNAGDFGLDIFIRSFMINYSIRVLHFQGTYDYAFDICIYVYKYMYMYSYISVSVFVYK
jgi:hypothetical protein